MKYNTNTILRMGYDSLRKAGMMLLPALLLSMNPFQAIAQKEKPVPLITAGRGGVNYVNDARGNHIPDYSWCGYHLSDPSKEIQMPVRAVVPCPEGDATADIQAAIDYVSSLQADKNGFRGVVLLEPGCYKVGGTLWVRQSGVVIRGSGFGPEGTEILSTVNDKTTLLRFIGQDDRQLGEALDVTDGIVPVGEMRICVPGHKLKVGDRFILRQKAIQVPVQDGRPAQRGRAIASSLQWEREVRRVDGKYIEMDAPVTVELSQEFRPAEILKLDWPGRLSEVGVENLRLTSIYDKDYPKDENHCWIAIAMENLQNARIRRIEFRHFAGSAVFVAPSATRLTIEDCKSLEPVSEIGAERRYTFYINGSQCLVQRIQAEGGYHDFAVGADVHGPNAFVQCWSINPYSFSGCIASWSSGILFDICSVSHNALRMDVPNPANLLEGWTTTGSTYWNSQASVISCSKPDFGMNWAFGAWGQFNGRGYWYGSNNHSSPWSLFYTQLQQRLGKQHPDASKLIQLTGGGTSSFEDARYQIAASRKPLEMLSHRIDTLAIQYPLDVKCPSATMRTVWKSFLPAQEAKEKAPALQVVDGVLVRDSKIVTGSRQNPAWWNGSPSTPARMSPHIVRYGLAPEGYGIVDDLDVMTDDMLAHGCKVTDFNYALWYERRRDDHTRVARIDGEVRTPLYELPFARSGEGKAYDGLSLYDLTRWNNWYWNRLGQYADLADQKGLVLIYQHYFQHNILEAGAHWADSPWRPVNNVNATDFPIPTPYAGNKRVFMAEHFYDETHPVRRPLHQGYIRQCMDNFADNGSVIHSISAEFSGPLHFTQFWVDEVSAWKKNHPESKTLVALSAPKNVQDSILMDARRAAAIDIIDIRYWYTDGKGQLYAPDGGLNLAPRQFERIYKPGTPGERQMYADVLKYRQAYPDKAVMYSVQTMNAWPAFMAGASLCSLPEGLPEDFLRDAALCQPQPGASTDAWVLASPGKCYIVYPLADTLSVDLSGENGEFTACWIDRRSGRQQGNAFKVQAGQVFRTHADAVLWLNK